MKQNLLTVAVGSALMLTTTTLLAVPFNSFDPKSMAMGGAGVAVANPATAPFFNPALLSIADTKDDFAIELPILGVRIYDPDDFVDAVDNFDQNAFDNLDAAINAYETGTDFRNVTPVTSAITAMDQEVQTISDKPMEFEAGGGMVVGIPGESFGMALSVSGSVNFSGIFEYRDSDKVSDLTADMNALPGCFPVVPDPVFTENCLTAPGTFNFVQVDNSNPANPLPDIIFNTDTSMESKVRIVGVAMAEVGLTFSREMSLFGTEVAVGITPKMVAVTVFDYTADADEADTDDFDGDNYTAEYSDFNMDIGVARDHGNGWRSGFVIKNIIGQDYDAIYTDPATGAETVTGTVSLKPQARAGVSHTNDWSTIALDVDLTKNDPLGVVGNASQYVALGVELNVFDITQLRLGYRADTVNSDRSVVSAGIGFSPFGVHFDLAVAGNENEVGAAFQFGFRF